VAVLLAEKPGFESLLHLLSTVIILRVERGINA
jgi:hypothetical protein